MPTPLTSRAFGRRMAGAGLVRRQARGGGSQGGFAQAMRSMGAIAHFDPSFGVTTSASVSQWIDRIAGYTVDQESAPTRMTYTSSLAEFGGQPAWIATRANATRMRGAAALAAAIDGSQAYTIYFVSKCASSFGFGTAFCAINGALTNYIFVAALATGAAISGRRFDSSTDRTSIVESGLGAALDVHCWSPSNDYTGWTNGTPAYSGGGGGPDQEPACDSFVFGSFGSIDSYDGYIGDFVVFPTVHTDAERRYVEQLIAVKYGWPVLQGLSGFSAANYLANAGLTSGIRGDNTNGVWADVLIRPDAVPAGTQYLESAWASVSGQSIVSSGALLGFTAGNAIVNSTSPTRTIAAADVGKLMFFGGSAGPANLARGFVNAAEIGAGSVLVGYAKDSATAFSVGARAAASPASSYSLFGIAGGDVEQVAANHAARAAAIKAASAFVATGGVTPTHAWALTSDAASFADLVGSDALTLTGTLARAQIIVPTWPW